MKLLGLALLPGLFASACVAGEESIDDIESVEGKADGIGGSTDPNRLANIPFYFGVPKQTISTTLPRDKYPYPTIWNASVQGDEVGLRMIAIEQGAGVEAHQRARREMASKLGRAGVLTDGDIVLTFRPELAGTMAYPHIQMGATHAGLVYTVDGVAYNLDSPLDSTYVGQFDAAHYAGNGGDDPGTDALHVLRPRIDDARRGQLREWVVTLKGNLPRINGERAQVKFQSDYLVPAYASKQATTQQTVTLLGKIILESDTTTKLPMYCSEFAWHMLALSACTADEIRAAGPAGAACVDPMFEPMPLVASTADTVGMAEGPLLSLMALPSQGRDFVLPQIFATGNSAKLSAGHRAVSEQVAPLMVPLADFFKARVAGLSVEDTAPVAETLSSNMPNNYSPTTFLVQAMTARTDRPFDYVVTLAFVGPAAYQKAKRLSSRPIP